MATALSRGVSAQLDRFVHERLPPPEQWPEMRYDLPELQLPDQLNLVEELLGESISKQQQSSDWGGPVLSDPQRDYAASDVRYLHRLRDELTVRLEREGRMHLAQASFDFLPTRALLDIAGWAESDIFSHM